MALALQGGKRAPRRCRTDTRKQLEHAKARDAVARILGPAQHRQHILDVRGLEELQAAELDERNVAPSEFDLELPRVVRGAEQHRLLAQFHARLAVRQDALDHELDLRRLVGHHGDHRPAATRAPRVQILGVALGGMADDTVAALQNRLGRAIVLFERDHLGRRIEPAGKLENVLAPSPSGTNRSTAHRRRRR